MHRFVVACLSSAALSLGSVAFAVGGASVANAAPTTAGIPLSGFWEVQIFGHCKSCETIKFDTTNKTFAEHDSHHGGDHGSYSLGHHVLNLLWTGGSAKGVTFSGTYNSTKHAFVGTYQVGHAYKGDLISIP